MSTKLLIASILTGIFALTACAQKSEEAPVESTHTNEKNTEVHNTEANQAQLNTQESGSEQKAEQSEVADSFEPGEIEKNVEENQQF
ncbi:hypothetical protein VH441_02900 [Psychrobacter sp. HD31]|uniref:hypothetical protein n=1 Tax=Psychrobacter sp. HD31 TaxID=3112003 RepID=UPI003DA2D132